MCFDDHGSGPKVGFIIHFRFNTRAIRNLIVLAASLRIIPDIVNDANPLAHSDQPTTVVVGGMAGFAREGLREHGFMTKERREKMGRAKLLGAALQQLFQLG